MGRFINVDELYFWDIEISVFSTNKYCYCNNEPIVNTDASGYIFAKTFARAILGAMYGALVQYISDVIYNLAKSIVICGKITSNIFVASGNASDYVTSIIGCAIDATLLLGPIGNIIKTACEAVITQIINWFDGKGFSVVEMIDDFICGVVFGVMSDKITNRFKPSDRKKFNKLIRDTYGVKGDNNYDYYWDLLMESINVKSFAITSFVDSLGSAVDRFIDLIKAICRNTFIEVFASV